MGRGKKRQRSGLVTRIEPPPDRHVPVKDPPALKAALIKFRDANSVSRKLAEARDRVDRMEFQAIKIYRRHGLPTVDAVYQRSPDGDWEPRSLAAEPRGALEGVPDQVTSLNWEVGGPPEIGRWDFPANTEVGFAAAILDQVRNARFTLDAAEANDDWATVTGFLRALTLAEAYSSWWEEFGLGDLVAPTLLQVSGRQEGGRKRGDKISKARAREWTRWQREADKIWSVSPGMEKASVAVVLVKRLGLSEKPDTVARRIKKAGSS